MSIGLPYEPLLGTSENEKKSPSLSTQKSRPTKTPPPATPKETKSIITSLQTTHNPANPPPPKYDPANRPPPPPSIKPGAAPTAASIARATIDQLRVFDDQARLTLAPFYVERERRRREKEPRKLEVPREFADRWGGMGGPGSGGEVKGQGGMVDQSRDPRLRRD
ncbi:MAG: hypothetical protein Q9178_006955 [Gyalolechia marmorata]